MTTFINVNRHIIQANKKHGRQDPALRVSTGKYGKPVYAHRVLVHGPSEFISNPDGSPVLPCGARIALKTESLVELITDAPVQGMAAN
jgi:hypothetical protein